MEPKPQYGPKMLALPKDSWRDFVYRLVDLGDGEPVKALREVWPTDLGANAARVQAFRLMHDDRVQAAIQEETSRRLVGLSALAVKAHTDVLKNPQAKDSDRLKAVEMVYSRAGQHGVIEHRQTVQMSDDPEQIKRVAAMARVLGMDVEQLLGRRLALLAPTIDMEPAELSEEEIEAVEYE